MRWHRPRALRLHRSAAFLRLYRLLPHGLLGRLGRALARATRPRWAVALAIRSWTERARIPVHGQPVFAVARPDGREIWVNFAHPDNDVVQIVDVPSLRVVDELRPGRAVLHIEFTPRGEQAWVSARDDDKVVVEGINTVTRNQRPTPRNQQGGQIKKDAPIHASKVMPVDPTTGKPTRVKIKVGEDGKKARVAKSGAEITAS